MKRTFSETPRTLLPLLSPPRTAVATLFTSSSSLVSIYGAADMTINVHDGGFGSGGHDDSEEGITGRRDSAARAGTGTCGDGVGHDGDGNGNGEPYVVFGYGSLIFRVRICRLDSQS